MILGQESMAKSLSTGSCANGSNGSGSASGTSGKLKRVRTIFTAEQLERLEGEFARQQYMVMIILFYNLTISAFLFEFKEMK